MSELDIQMEVSLEIPDIQIAVENTGAGLPYAGEYEVTPVLYESQTLPTAGCTMKRDITVEAIPMTAVSNPRGGLTILIG